jgi:hypothetical protein
MPQWLIVKKHYNRKDQYYDIQLRQLMGHLLFEKNDYE